MQVKENSLREIVRKEILKRSSVVNKKASGEPFNRNNGLPLQQSQCISESTERNHVILSEGLKYHINNDLKLFDPVYRPGSKEFFDLLKEAKTLYRKGLYNPTDEEKEILESDICEWGVYRGKQVPLDFPMWDNEIGESFSGHFEKNKRENSTNDNLSHIQEAKYKGREVTLGAGGAQKSGGRSHVYVRDPKTGKVKKVSFGSSAPDAMGSSDAHKKRRKSFGERHNCGKNKDKLSASYWACRATKMFGRSIPGWW
jgi:hypothetical protein